MFLETVGNWKHRICLRIICVYWKFYKLPCYRSRPRHWKSKTEAKWLKLRSRPLFRCRDRGEAKILASRPLYSGDLNISGVPSRFSLGCNDGSITSRDAGRLLGTMTSTTADRETLVGAAR